MITVLDPFGNRVESTTSATGGVTILMIAQVPLDGVETFEAYEAAVLPLLAEHGGTLVSRLRSDDGTQEVHIVTFPSRSALLAYRNDERRLDRQPLLEASRARIATHELEAPLS